MHIESNIHRACNRWASHLALLGLLWTLFIPFAARSDTDDDDRQYKIEAAFLYNFFNYITWPGYSSPQSLQQPTACVYGKDPVEPYLGYIQHKMAQTRPFVVRELLPGESPQSCNILFMRNQPSPNTASTPGLLLISEAPGAINSGSMIELGRENERIRMKINQTLLEQNRFQISSRLLSLAEEVK